MFIRELTARFTSVELIEVIERLVCLQNPFQNKKTVSLEGDEVFTQVREGVFAPNRLGQLISNALTNNYDCIFVVVENFLSEIFIYDGASFSMLIENAKYERQHIIGNCPILDAYFYIIKKEQTLDEIQENGISLLCTLKEFVDKKNFPYFDHVVVLSDPFLEISKRYSMEYQLALDYLQGRGVQKNVNLAADYAENQALTGNPYCQLFLAFCFRFGIGRSIDSQRVNYWEKLAYTNLLAKDFLFCESYEELSSSSLLQGKD